MAKKLDYTIIDLVENAANSVRVKPLNLGAIGGGGGGVGGPPGGYIGWLPQTRVAYDEDELATLDTAPSGFNPPSGWSLLDNLNHIRARLQTLESGILVVDEWDGSPSINPTNHITFSGGVIVTDLGGGHALITMSGGGGEPSGAAGGDLSGTYPDPSVIKASGVFSFAGAISASISATEDNWNPTGLSTATVIKVTTDATPRSITGLDSTSAIDGTIKIIENNGVSNLVLSDNSGSSLATNRFDLADDIVLEPSDGVILMYNTTISRWRCIGVSRGSVITYMPYVVPSTAGKVLTSDGSDWISVIPDGWITVTDTWTYASASTITIPTDGTTKYQKGMPLRFKQGGGYKYFNIASVTSTLITVFVDTDYTVANSAITEIAYSFISNPMGFPEWFNRTAIGILTGTSGSAGSYAQSGASARFKVSGQTITEVVDLLVTDVGSWGGDVRLASAITVSSLETTPFMQGGVYEALTTPSYAVKGAAYPVAGTAYIKFLYLLPSPLLGWVDMAPDHRVMIRDSYQF